MNSEVDTKRPMSDTERLELCQKLDSELDDFINSLERKRYTEGWPEDRWEVLNIFMNIITLLKDIKFTLTSHSTIITAPLVSLIDFVISFFDYLRI